MNSEYYHKDQCTCDILMASKFLYLIMDLETFNSFMTEVPII